MDSPAERKSFRLWIWVGVIIAVALLFFQRFLMGPAQDRSVSWAEVFASVIPNFIAGLVAAFVVYFLVREDDRTHYVQAMRSLRNALRQLSDEGKIKSEDVQSLMVKFVPAISTLYFRKNEPPISEREAGVKYDKQHCFACNKPEPVKCGRCSKCHDSLDSWREEERP
ncbi:MAG TPA: hypothetical protein VKA60_23880 [Blastocatellia bacterium]|nr:hypothetical protein [Blastocatellia bacterium]